MFRSKFLWLLIVVFAPAPRLLAVNNVSTADQSVRQVISRAGYVFAGTVISIQRRAAGTSAVDSVQITFHVDRAVRGVRTGQSLTIREWGGLWASGERYRVGQQVVLCLYKPSKLGLTSPVGGSLGEINVDQDGEVLLQRDWQAGTSAATPHAPVRRTVREFTRLLRRLAEE